VVVYNISLLQATPHLTSYDVTALAMINPRKHQGLTDPLLQSDVITLNNRA